MLRPTTLVDFAVLGAQLLAEGDEPDRQEYTVPEPGGESGDYITPHYITGTGANLRRKPAFSFDGDDENGSPQQRLHGHAGLGARPSGGNRFPYVPPGQVDDLCAAAYRSGPMISPMHARMAEMLGEASLASGGHPPRGDFASLRAQLAEQQMVLEAHRAEQTESRLAEMLMMEDRDLRVTAAEMRAEQMAEERDEALAACAEERADREAAEALLADASEYIAALQRANRQLEGTVASLMVECAEVVGEAEARLRHEQGRAAPPRTPAPEAFGLGNTRAAIERAVKEAAELPDEERKKKLRALRLKWHPDKHDVLKDMATEVTKMINEAIEEADKARAAQE